MTQSSSLVGPPMILTSELSPPQRRPPPPLLVQLGETRLHRFEHRRRCRLRRTRIERRRRIIFDLQLDFARDLFALEDGGEREREIDARGDAGPGYDMAVHHYLFAHRNGAEQ